MEKINGNHQPAVKIPGKPRILVAPLDWGLGHATRCIPIIHELIRQNAEVWIAAERKQGALLKAEFPGLSFLSLPGYRIRYGRNRWGMIWSIFFQTPQIFKAIKDEHRWLKKAVSEYGFDAIISDNRFGMYHDSAPSVFITHQLLIKTPFGKWADKALQKKNYRFINRFTECWIPDTEEKNSLAGELSHPQNKPAIPIRYISLLSRLKKLDISTRKDHLFISLSGPEPQRTILENKIIQDIGHYHGTATIVRGLPDSSTIIPSTNAIKFYNHLPADEYNKEIQQAEFVIGRSGYSTVMDIISLGKKSILIPTPGQTEQEYLAKYLLEKKFAFPVLQKDFSLKKALEKAKVLDFNYKTNDYFKENGLSSAIAAFIKRAT
jgi:uncharacterized protein (TIGR00661 family)